MNKIYSFLLSSVLAFVIIACSRNAITGRKQFKLLPEETLASMAVSEYQTFLSQSKVLSTTVNRDAEMVTRVGKRLTNSVNEFYASKNMANELAAYKWEYNLVESKDVNAWCMPGGKIVVYTGLLPVTRNEAALAAVMGHEISHALFNHGNERMSQGLVQQLGGVALQVALANKPQETQMLFNTAYGIGSQVGVMLPFSRKHELEADKYGLIWMAMSGYNPQEAVNLWERMAAAGGGQRPPEILSTHPAEETRIAKIKEFLPEAMKYYKPMGSR